MQRQKLLCPLLFRNVHYIHIYIYLSIRHTKHTMARIITLNMYSICLYLICHLFCRLFSWEIVSVFLLRKQSFHNFPPLGTNEISYPSIHWALKKLEYLEVWWVRVFNNRLLNALEELGNARIHWTAGGSWSHVAAIYIIGHSTLGAARHLSICSKNVLKGRAPLCFELLFIKRLSKVHL